jgi:hypothetical protein
MDRISMTSHWRLLGSDHFEFEVQGDPKVSRLLQLNKKEIGYRVIESRTCFKVFTSGRDEAGWACTSLWLETSLIIQLVSLVTHNKGRLIDQV